METMSTENIGVGPTCETVYIHLCWCHVCNLCLVIFWPIVLSQPSSRPCREFVRVAEQLRLHNVHLRLHHPQRVVGGFLEQSLVGLQKW